MEVAEALYAYLSGYAGLTALVSTRIYPQRLPQNVTMPAVVFWIITSPKVGTRDSGASSAAMTEVQVDCWAASAETDKPYEIAHAVAKQVRLALDGYSGTMGGAGGVRVDGAKVIDQFDDFDVPLDLQRSILRVWIFHTEETS